MPLYLVRTRTCVPPDAAIVTDAATGSVADALACAERAGRTAVAVSPVTGTVSAAVSDAAAFVRTRDMTVYLVTDAAAEKNAELAAFLSAHYRPLLPFLRRQEHEPYPRCYAAAQAAPPGAADTDGFVPTVSETFSEMLFRLIDERGMTDPDVYRRANLDRKLFSKIRSRCDYRPSKNTALALCIALRLNIDQTSDLLRRAGIALSPASRFDLIVEYCIRSGQYDIFAVNELLFAYDQSLLGA